MSRCGPRSGGRGIFHRRPFRNTRIWNRIFLNHRRTKQTVEFFGENYEERKRPITNENIENLRRIEEFD